MKKTNLFRIFLKWGGLPVAPTIIFLCLLLTLPVAALSQENPKVKVQNKVPLKVKPFDLTAVRLLDGPFKEAMERDKKYLLSLDLDRLLHNFRVNAGLPSTAKPLGGWETPTVELRGHTLGHFLTANAFMYASTGDARFKLRGYSVVAALEQVQDALPKRGFNPGYLSAYPEELIDRVEAVKPVWAPYYTLHKIMAGLLDMYLYCDNRLALQILEKKADWVKFRMDRLTTEQQQAMLQNEFGGMNDVLANLYAVTANPEHLRLARLFDHEAFFGPLSRGVDSLDGLHGNTQFPKIIGAVREYELTGEKRYIDIARFFWDRIVNHRSFVIGGNTNDEGFFPINYFSKNLGISSTETCNTYNMLKLSRNLFAHEPSAEIMDFYERGLYNQILASQDPATGMVCYYVSLKPGAYKTYSTPDSSFWCCVGTGMENHAKYGETIYFHNDSSLYVNLFIPSELNWKEKGLVLRQETRFPEEDKSKLILKLNAPAQFTVNIRYPAWVRDGMIITVNGKKQSHAVEPVPYVPIEREWKDGDVMEIETPMSVRLERMPDNPDMVALLYGPIVLAGNLGTEGLDDTNRYGPSAPGMSGVQPVEVGVPVFTTNEIDLVKQIKPVEGKSLTFRTEGVGYPKDVTLFPLYTISQERFAVYWKLSTPEEWDNEKARMGAHRERRKEIDRLKVDMVNVNDRKNEQDHNFKVENPGEHWFDGRRGREGRNGGWFSYEMKVLPDEPQVLVCKYRGSQGVPREFDILVDGAQIATQSLNMHHGEFFDVEYPLPVDVAKGKEKVTLTFRAHPGAFAGAVYQVWVVRK
ncbi:MAG: glycoside hydrolase family 127 protein [Ignavibacteriae bacterium]|nr:glycoside hydrolase family 127 protein [Ignavibacteriota bacterium]